MVGLKMSCLYVMAIVKSFMYNKFTKQMKYHLGVTTYKRNHISKVQ